MTEVREVIERVSAGDLAEAFACFAPRLHRLGLSGPMNNEQHLAAARRLKHAMPDCHMELVRVLEAGDEVYVTGRFKGTRKNDLARVVRMRRPA